MVIYYIFTLKTYINTSMIIIMSIELNPYNFTANTISWLYEKGLENHNETCNMILFSGEFQILSFSVSTTPYGPEWPAGLN